MRIRQGVAVAGAVTAISLLATAGAGAATKVGNECTVSTGAGNIAAVQLAKDPASPLPIATPIAGVVTKWQVTLIEVPESVPTKMMVFRPTADPKQFQAVAESPTVTVHSGANVFDVRIPVQAGDRFASGGATPGGALYCFTGSTLDVVGLGILPPVGGTFATLVEQDEVLVGVLATVEPDADGDGYGDETQDLCPQSASFQAACPVLVLDAYALPGNGAAKVLVSSSIETTITVSGTAALPKSKGKASSSAKAKLKKVKKKVKPGKIAKFTLKFPGSLKSALSSLAPGKAVSLKIKASGKNLAGVAGSDKTTLKLKGSG